MFEVPRHWSPPQAGVRNQSCRFERPKGDQSKRLNDYSHARRTKEVPCTQTPGICGQSPDVARETRRRSHGQREGWTLCEIQIEFCPSASPGPRARAVQAPKVGARHIERLLLAAIAERLPEVRGSGPGESL